MRREPSRRRRTLPFLESNFIAYYKKVKTALGRFSAWILLEWLAFLLAFALQVQGTFILHSISHMEAITYKVVYKGTCRKQFTIRSTWRSGQGVDETFAFMLRDNYMEL